MRSGLIHVKTQCCLFYDDDDDDDYDDDDVTIQITYYSNA